GPRRDDEAARQRGLLVGVGAMLLVPAALLGVVLAYVPRLRPWAAEPVATAATVVDAEQAVPEGKALVAGRVVDDEGEPVEGARVAAVVRGARLAEQTTGRGGLYALVLDPGTLTLVAEHDERMVASAELPLRAGEARRDLVLPLALTRTVRGRVTGADGAAVAGAQVRVEGLPWLQRSGTSEPDGVYRLTRVPAAEATLRVTAPGYAVASVRLRPPAAPGDEVLDVRLSPEEDIEGQVLDASGQPLAAEVQACDGRETGQRLATDPAGTFKLTRVFARCPLVAYHDSFSPSEPALAEGGRVTLRLRAGGSIEGVVVDEATRPVRPFTLGVESFVPSFGDRTAVGGEARPFDDAAGAFRLDRLAPGSYVL
ncbi:MAG: carboxypeptidase regulatory-like domain-containing protein, partial [Myxococcales bacterium]